MNSFQDWTIVVFWTLVGLIFGSFVNVIVTRVPEGRSIVHPPSRCPHCLAPIGFWENIPIISYFFLGGRCRHCKEPIGWRYPATEAGVAVAFGVVVWRLWVTANRPAAAILVMAATVVFVSVAIIDAKTKRIPRKLVYWGLVMVIPLSVVVAVYEARPAALIIALASSMGYGIALFAIHSIDPRWMGFGDVRYAFFLGWVLGYFGWWYPLAGFMLALVIGSVVGLTLVAVGKSRLGKTIPFGPFLSLGAYAVLLWGCELAGLYLHLMGLPLAGCRTLP
ncbi:MAG: prepilin peptidase [Acidimicrobiia bacterium]